MSQEPKPIIPEPKPFDAWFSAIDGFTVQKSRNTVNSRKEQLPCSNYLRITWVGNNYESNTESFVAMPTPYTMDLVADNMLCIEHDSAYFEIITNDGVEGRLYSKYNLILGSRWLGNVVMATIPLNTNVDLV